MECAMSTVLEISGKSERRWIAMLIEYFIIYEAWLWCDYDCDAMQHLYFVCGNCNVVEVRWQCFDFVKIIGKSVEYRQIGRILLNSGEIGTKLRKHGAWSYKMRHRTCTMHINLDANKVYRSGRKRIKTWQ